MSNRTESASACTFTGDFLISKARSEIHPELHQADPGSANTDIAVRYPEAPRGDEWVLSAVQRLADNRAFGAMKLEIDPSPNAAVEKSQVGPASTEAVVQSLDAECRAVGGLWGLPGGEVLGCAVPDADQTAMVEMAGRIKARLLRTGGRTVTIGIATFPTLDYEAKDIFKNARKALEHAKFFGSDSLVCFDAVSLNISADRLYDNGDLPGAVKEYANALLLDPSDANLHNSLGVCHGVAGELAPALERFKAAAKLDPSDPMAFFNAGLVQLMLGNRKQALDFLLIAESKPQKLFEVTLQLGKYYLEENDFLRARPYLESAVERQPDSARAHGCLAECYSSLQMTEEAVCAYKRSLRMNANDAASLSGLGWLYNRMGKNHEIALLFCRHSVDLSPAHGLYRYRLGKLYLKENRLDEARRQFEKAVALGHDATGELESVRNRSTHKAS